MRYSTSYLKEHGEIVDRLGYNIHVIRYNNRLILIGPHEVLAYIIPKKEAWTYTTGRLTEYRRNKVRAFFNRYAYV